MRVSIVFFAILCLIVARADDEWIVEYKNSVRTWDFISGCLNCYSDETAWKRFTTKRAVLEWLDEQDYTKILGVYRLLPSNIARVMTGKEMGTEIKKIEVEVKIERGVYHWRDNKD